MSLPTKTLDLPQDYAAALNNLTRMNELQRRIADYAAREAIYAHCAPVHENDLVWWRPLSRRAELLEAIEYLLLRGFIERDGSGRLVQIIESEEQER